MALGRHRGIEVIFDDADDLLVARDFRRLIGVVVAGTVLSVAAIVLTRRFVYADSSAFLLGMWQSGSFFIPNGSRWFGFGVTQWIPVAAMKLGMTDLGAIATLYGLNLWLNPIVAVLFVWWASGRSRETTSVALLAVLFLFQCTYIVLDNEANVFLWLAAAMLVLTLRRDFSYWALLLFVPILFSHEVAMLALGPILVVLLVARDAYLRYYGSGRYWSLVAAIAAVVGLVAVRALSPNAGPNRTYFLEGAVSLPGSPTLVLTTLAFGALLIQAYRPSLTWTTWVFRVSVGMLLLLPFVLPGVIWPFFHYRARILNAVLALALFCHLHGRVHWRLPPLTVLAGPRVVALVVVLFVFQGKVTWEWHRHLTLFRAELSGAQGIVDFPQEGPFSEPRSRQFSWSWTSPTRSVVFQAIEEGQVRAIMLNADTTIWQPFHPRVAEELPDLSAWGISYAPELGAGAGSPGR